MNPATWPYVNLQIHEQDLDKLVTFIATYLDERKKHGPLRYVCDVESDTCCLELPLIDDKVIQEIGVQLLDALEGRS